MNRYFIGIMMYFFLLTSPSLLIAEQINHTDVESNPKIVLQQINTFEKVHIGNTLRIRVTIKNGSYRISPTRVTLSPPQSLRLSCNDRDMGNLLDFKLPLMDKESPENRDMLPHELYELGVIVLQGPSLVEPKNWGMLAYRPQKETVFCEFVYDNAENEVPGRTYQSLDIDVFAHPLCLFAGAVVGTFLGTLFVTLVRVQKAVEGLTLINVTNVADIIGMEIVRAGFIFVKATIAAGIVILVLQSASGVKFPIEISVNDFFGGLVMGLIGERVASTVYEWIIKA